MLMLSLVMLHTTIAVPMTFAPDRMAEIDGKRTFILGIYEDPKDDRILKDVAAAGFNLVNAKPDIAALDRLHAHGLHAWIAVGSNIDFSANRTQREAALKAMVAKLAHNPALIAWEVPDEALWNCWSSRSDWTLGVEPKEQREAIAKVTDPALREKLTALRKEADAQADVANYAQAEQIADTIWKKLGKKQPRPGFNLSSAPEAAAKLCAGLEEGYQRLKTLDPQHPIWMNYAPRNEPAQLARFAKAADVVGCDIYPVPSGASGHSDLMDTSLSSVGAYTDRFQQAGPGKPVWMVLQGFGWRDIEHHLDPAKYKARRRPTDAESRFMAYDAIVHGARGILYWGTNHVEKNSDFWHGLLKLVRELADLQPTLSAPDTSLKLTTTFAQTDGSVDRSVRVLGKDVHGALWLLVVNEWPSPLRYTIHGLTGLDGKGYSDTVTGARATVKNGELTLGISGNGAQVLRPSRS